MVIPVFHSTILFQWNIPVIYNHLVLIASMVNQGLTELAMQLSGLICITAS